MLKITLRQMEVFAAVAAAGSTGAAAQAVGLSQSATSAALNELEAALGGPLFDRVGRRLRLGGLGHELLPRVRVLLDGARAIEHWSEEALAGATDLRIGASTTIGNYLLPRLLASYRAALPPAWQTAWTAHVRIANTQDVARQVADFALDIGLIEGPCHEAGLQVLPWLQDELVIVAGARAARAAGWLGPVVSIEALQAAPWLLRESGSGTREAILQALAPHLQGLREGIQFANSEAIKHAVAEGLGISCLSRWVVADALTAGHLVELQTPLPPLSRPLGLVVHRDKVLAPGLLRFQSFLREVAAAPMPVQAV
ncbi:MAG: HTH-type transcriptional activator CmpR [Paracidovorax wautersii]|uniref:HTH-type transcriptional activator CmpR n=1 Tax=Paracidovorax wautersii TaxID=1177982 RepID=A0A7V8JQ31_9BURK|nr:MAG: HTH-type transcriptional activator CmpR [Paracidovorax wautersii]